MNRNADGSQRGPGDIPPAFALGPVGASPASKRAKAEASDSDDVEADDTSPVSAMPIGTFAHAFVELRLFVLLVPMFPGITYDLDEKDSASPFEVSVIVRSTVQQGCIDEIAKIIHTPADAVSNFFPKREFRFRVKSMMPLNKAGRKSFKLPNDQNPTLRCTVFPMLSPGEQEL